MSDAPAPPVGPVRTEVVAREVAEAEFTRFAESRDIDMEIFDTDVVFDAAREVLLRGLIGGYVTVDDDANPVFTPRFSADKEALTFHRPTGATLLGADKKGIDRNIERMFAMAAEVTKRNEPLFAKMDSVDSRVVMALITIFLG